MCGGDNLVCRCRQRNGERKRTRGCLASRRIEMRQTGQTGIDKLIPLRRSACVKIKRRDCSRNGGRFPLSISLVEGKDTGYPADVKIPLWIKRERFDGLI